MKNKITVIYSNPYNDTDFEQYIKQLLRDLNANSVVTVFDLKKIELNYCTGCWSCWWKTPGICALKDEATPIFKSVIESYFLIFASPLIGGFVSADIKKITDRLIVLLLPYITLINGESHHHKRYDKYPQFGLVLKSEPDTDEEDIKIINNIYDRFALNFHSQCKFVYLSDNVETETIAHEISTI